MLSSFTLRGLNLVRRLDLLVIRLEARDRLITG
jgi:hypothetical protein